MITCVFSPIYMYFFSATDVSILYLYKNEIVYIMYIFDCYLGLSTLLIKLSVVERMGYIRSIHIFEANKVYICVAYNVNTCCVATGVVLFARTNIMQMVHS